MKRNQYINVPTVFTALNLFCGYWAIILTIREHYVNAGWLIVIAAAFDALDGKIARASGQSSDFGLQMDSLADLVSSGVAVSVLIYRFNLSSLGAIGLMLSFFPLVFSAFRLARYNLKSTIEGRKDGFSGLPAPMAAVMIVSMVLLMNKHQDIQILARLLLVLIPLTSMLMASNIAYEGFPRLTIKEKGKNLFKIIALVTALTLVAFMPEYTLFGFMLIYIVSGPIFVLRTILTRQENNSEEEIF